MDVHPYLFLDGRCEEAIEFYRAALGAEIELLMRYRDAPDPAMCPPGAEDRVMHATLKIGAATLMASDGHCGGDPEFKGFALSLPAADEGEARRLFDALSDGGQIQMPLEKTFWSPAFGMVADRFGVAWMVNVDA